MNITMFGPLSWRDTWYSRHHLTVGLARRHRVVVVAEPIEARALLRAPGLLFSRPRMMTETLGMQRIDAPGWLPHVHGFPPLRRWLYARRAQWVRRLAMPSVCYVWHPDYEEAAAPLTDIPLVYHCYDKYDRYVDAPAATVRQRETRLARRAVLCVAASAKLGEYLQERGAQRVLVLRHGVDPEQFRPGLTPPDALAAIPRPRIGVVARLNEALDVEALLRVAAARPQWSLVLVGGSHFSDPARGERFAALCRLPNVHHVGPQPQADIPRWLCGLDVGLACYDLATWGPYNQPIKLYEYLACGLPVASSDIQAARELGDLVERCTPDGDWVSAIEQSLAPPAPALAERRRAFARANSWERRVTELDEALRAIPGVH